MDIQGRKFASPLNTLLCDVKRTDFFQAIYSLLLYNSEAVRPGELGPFKDELIRFRANTSLGFPESDIESLEIEASASDVFPEYTLTVNNIGLYGAASPLPAHYSELLLNDVDLHNSPRHFLDLFNHRIVGLLYRVWDKYQYTNRFKPDLSDSHSTHLLSLFGFGAGSSREDDSEIEYCRLMPFASLLSGRRRSSSTIERVLTGYFDTPCRIESFVPEVIPIAKTQQTSIGLNGCKLGEEAIVGKTVVSVNTKYRVHIGPVDHDVYLKFLPGGEFYKSVRQLLTQLVLDNYAYDVWVSLISDQFRGGGLSNVNPSLLGRTSRIGGVSGTCVIVKQQGNQVDVKL